MNHTTTAQMRTPASMTAELELIVSRLRAFSSVAYTLEHAINKFDDESEMVCESETARLIGSEIYAISEELERIAKGGAV